MQIAMHVAAFHLISEDSEETGLLKNMELP